MNQLQIIEFNNQRILTTQQLADAYETNPQVITNNFNRNKSRYLEGKHYAALEGEVKREFLYLNQIELGSNAKTFYIWTEKGEFGVETYKGIKRNQLDVALSIVNDYKVPLAIKKDIDAANNQQQMIF